MHTVAPQMLELFELIRRAGRSEATVLVRGESGTGKELVAGALHRESARGSKPFYAVNCATFTSEMLASELFGHVRGAFTGAIRDRDGLLAMADKGTLFLDEVAELPIELQARLLRVLQTQRFTPVGGTVEQQVDVRFFSATNVALRKAVAEGRFREDLMYRLRVVVLYLPRLADRTGDVEALTWHFIDAFNARGGRRVHAVAPAAWAAMQAYGWPGNVRELMNNLESAFVLGEGPVLTLDELAPEIRGQGTRHDEPSRDTLQDLERQQLVEAFAVTGGHRGRMAEHLGVSRPTLYRRLKKHGLT
ncbi:MAG: sigma-54-dependent Fis family transcriptional regulator [Proteobacteria bacterium]|nr:sigma-54-dependent Fis family transcriptional regulator [Pseudomonadota bacterium]